MIDASSFKGSACAKLEVVLEFCCNNFYEEIMLRLWNKKIAFGTMLLILSAHQAYAAEASDSKPQTAICDKGGWMDMFTCLQKKQFDLEKEMNSDLAQAKGSFGSAGTDPLEVNEKEQRLQDSQDAWLKYRKTLCERDYYTKSPIHAASASAEITACKIKKTQQRIDEIKHYYLEGAAVP